MGIIVWSVVELIAGTLGKLIMPGDDPGEIIVTILLAVVGAFVGGFVVNLFGEPGSWALTCCRHWLLRLGRSYFWRSTG